MRKREELGNDIGIKRAIVRSKPQQNMAQEDKFRGHWERELNHWTELSRAIVASFQEKDN